MVDYIRDRPNSTWQQWWGSATSVDGDIEIWSVHTCTLGVDLLKRVPSLMPKPEADLRLHGRHLEKSIWRHNSAGGGSIWLKFGRSMQNHIPTRTEMQRCRLVAMPSITGRIYVIKSQILNKENCTQFYNRINHRSKTAMNLFGQCGITNHIGKLLHLQHTTANDVAITW